MFKDAKGCTLLTKISTLSNTSFSNASVGFNVITSKVNISGIDIIGNNASVISIGNISSTTNIYGTTHLGNVSVSGTIHGLPRICSSIWNTDIIQNNGSPFDINTNTFTCKYSGIYICSVICNSPINTSINLSYNHSTIELVSGINSLSGTISIFMNEGDKLSFNTTTTTNTNTTINPLYSIALTF